MRLQAFDRCQAFFDGSVANNLHPPLKRRNRLHQMSCRRVFYAEQENTLGLNQDVTAKGTYWEVDEDTNRSCLSPGTKPSYD